MTYKPLPFRATPLRRHYFPVLYFDADHIKPLNNKSILFRASDTQRWKRATKGAQALRHPRGAYHADPVSVMCVVEMLMRIDIHSYIIAKDLAQLLNEDYKDFIWAPLNVGKMLGHIFDAVEKTNAPKWGRYGPIWRHKGKKPIQGTWVYYLYPDRETYIWLAKLLQRLIDFNYQVIRKERATKTRANYGHQFPAHILWDAEFKGDTRNVPITKGIVFRQL